tara:strand:+ start:818 stop:1216 length:399 start_codon:yes stop_codon:yes gene_type:complete
MDNKTISYGIFNRTNAVFVVMIIVVLVMSFNFWKQHKGVDQSDVERQMEQQELLGQIKVLVVQMEGFKGQIVKLEKTVENGVANRFTDEDGKELGQTIQNIIDLNMENTNLRFRIQEQRILALESELKKQNR